jgi:glycosyltransferase involved in cell wall biosynthesis
MLARRTGRARNNGLRRTEPRSEYVAFLDHDDTWEPDGLETLIGALSPIEQCSPTRGARVGDRPTMAVVRSGRPPSALQSVL